MWRVSSPDCLPWSAPAQHPLPCLQVDRGSHFVYYELDPSCSIYRRMPLFLLLIHLATSCLYLISVLLGRAFCLLWEMCSCSMYRRIPIVLLLIHLATSYPSLISVFLGRAFCLLWERSFLWPPTGDTRSRGKESRSCSCLWQLYFSMWQLCLKVSFSKLFSCPEQQFTANRCVLWILTRL